MKTTFNLCNNPKGCCPKLVTNRNGNDLNFQVTDDHDGEIRLTDDEARLLALQILEELGKK